MSNPEMGTLRGVELVCVCRCRFLLTCTRTGELDIGGLCLKCWECGRILSHDGVVIGQVKVGR